MKLRAPVEDKYGTNPKGNCILKKDNRFRGSVKKGVK